jgi:ribosomal protein S18 acetylase RimI-like enzyme
MNDVLDNIFWHSLAGPHAKYAAGAADARRYAPGFSPIAGFASAGRPNLEALAPHCNVGEQLYCNGWSGAIHAGWRIDVESTIFRMVWDAATPTVDEAPEAVLLGPQHVAAALELATLTHPGPFGPRTIELGDYFGCFVGQRLVAMAGERMHAGRLREISGVCTHPDFQGRGFARRLIVKLIGRQLRRDETPFLHVMCDNAEAHRLYERMGFRDYSETCVRVISRC